MNQLMRWRKLVLICGVVMVAFFVGRSRISAGIEEAVAQQQDLQVTLTRLKNEQNALQDELKQIGSEDYIENRARTDYQYMKPGELRFEIVNPDALYGYTTEELQIRLEEAGGT